MGKFVDRLEWREGFVFSTAKSMISYEEFGQLRLCQFVHPDSIRELADWEFMDEIWVGEAYGFSEWLRLQREPEVLRSLAIDFEDLPVKVVNRVLKRIDLPLRRGMTLNELVLSPGEPKSSHVFVADRVSYDFEVGSPAIYRVSCTVMNEGGLRYLVIMVPLS